MAPHKTRRICGTRVRDVSFVLCGGLLASLGPFNAAERPTVRTLRLTATFKIIYSWYWKCMIQSYLIQWALQVMFPSACSFIVVVFHRLSLHVSAYMAIFKCVGYLFSYAWRILLRCFFGSLSFFHVVTLCLFSICVLFLCCFPSLFFLFPCVCVCLLGNEGQKWKNKTKKNKWKLAECDHVEKRQRSRILQAYDNKYPTHLKMASEAESFKHMIINILHTWRWPCRQKHVVKDSGKPTYNKATRRRKHNLQNPLNNTVQQDAKI
jgi:hypothetical protein